MQFRDQLDFIFQHLKKSKLRIAMTILATTMGCAFLIILASVAFGLQETMENEIFSSDDVTEISLWETESLDQDDIKEISNMEHVNVVLERTNLYSFFDVTFGDRTLTSEGVALDMEAQSKLPPIIKEGRLPENAFEIVVGAHFANGLLNEEERAIIDQKAIEAAKNDTRYNGEDEGYKGDLLNKTIDIAFSDDQGNVVKTETFTIVGVKKNPDYEFINDTSVIFNPAYFELNPTFETYKEHTIYVDTLENVLPLVDKLKENGYAVYSPLEQMKEIKVVFLILKIALVFIGTIAVLIASIGIFNTMTMAVTERTREIGILKAIGASPKLIQRLFLMESLLIGVIGTVIAIIISYIVSITGNFLFPIIVEKFLLEGEPTDATLIFSRIPLSLILISSFISLFVAVVSGWRPARKATKIEVVQALQQI